MNHPTSGWNSGSMGTSGTSRRFKLTIAIIITLMAVVLSGIAALVILLTASVPS